MLPVKKKEEQTVQGQQNAANQPASKIVVKYSLMRPNYSPIKQHSTPKKETGIMLSMTVIEEILSGQLTQLVRQVQAGNEVLLTQDHKPVARLVPLVEKEITPGTALRVRSLKGHRVMAPVFSQEELAEEIFTRK